MATTFAEHISLNKVGDHFVSSYLPQRMGNAAPIAYGGYAISLGIHAAYKTAPEGFHIFSAMGHFLRPASTELNLICTPVELRKTKNFVTYRVAVEQEIPPMGERRLCMELLVDFHKDEPAVMDYSAPPTRAYSHWRDCLPWEQVLEEQWVKPGKISGKQLKIFNTLFGLSQELYDGRPCPEGIMTQNLMGFAKTLKTTQEDSPPTAKTSADWIRAKTPLPTEGETMAALGFMMDGMLSFSPLSHNHMFFDDVDACSSLDFALRFFKPCPNLGDWHLREVIGHRAGHGRTYSESRLWDEQGNLVVSMTQQSIMRAPKRAKI